MDDKVNVIVIRESVWASIVRDLVSAATLMCAVGMGIWIGSEALQWIAGLLWIVWLIGKSFALFNNSKMTVAQARIKLDQIEAAQ